MPLMVNIAVKKTFKVKDAAGNVDEKATKEVLAAAAKSLKLPGGKTMDYATAMENVRLSNGLYEIEQEAPVAPAVSGPRDLEDMTVEELKLIIVQSGVKVEGKAKKADVIAAIRAKMDQIDIED